MEIVKSYFNEDGCFPAGNIITYYSGNNLCYRFVEKADAYYWSQGVSFEKAEEVKDAFGLFITEHPMEQPGLVGYFKSEKDACAYAKLNIAKQVYGEPVKYKIEQTHKNGVLLQTETV